MLAAGFHYSILSRAEVKEAVLLEGFVETLLQNSAAVNRPGVLSYSTNVSSLNAMCGVIRSHGGRASRKTSVTTSAAFSLFKTRRSSVFRNQRNYTQQTVARAGTWQSLLCIPAAKPTLPVRACWSRRATIPTAGQLCKLTGVRALVTRSAFTRVVARVADKPAAAPRPRSHQSPRDSRLTGNSATWAAQPVIIIMLD